MTRSHRQGPVRGIFKQPMAVTLSLPLVFATDRFAAQGLPVENASPVPIAILFVGAFVLGGFIVYGILRNRTRTRAEKELTDRMTRQNYAKEDQKARSATSEN